ncbi:iron ABC transporter permease [Kocuria sp.]|uniref:FecCD family ABC transporter permease n=1 Tax=Kocuria sp. TaxID=1871328 RepID=UPI0026DB4CBA|nr:iron chelate uptake ABC transporter family permease subunit [Kocuria sp.]MDO4920144.1 iron chelate uptake ABC transporter family permease subunit [Kocuria sp.]
MTAVSMLTGTTTAAASAKAGTAAPDVFRSRRVWGLLLLLAALVGAATLSLLVGSNMRSLPETVDALLHRDGSETSLIVWTLRVPRTVLAVVSGVAFALAGGLIQALTRNPLADPGILGVNAGSGLAVTLGVGLFGATGGHSVMWLAFGGALLATVCVYLVGGGGRGQASPVTLVLAGVALGALFGGVGAAVELLDPETFRALRSWGLGTVAVVDFSGVALLVPYLLVALVLVLVIAPSLNALALGDEFATALGSNVARTRVLGLVAVTLLAGGGTALTGGIAFVGLMVPHVVRWFTGPDQRWVLGYCLLAGPVLVLLADVLGRVLTPPSEIEAGLVTAVVGAPVLIALVRRKRASGL